MCSRGIRGDAEEVGVQVLDQLAAADTQLKPGQAAELAKLALAGIPELTWYLTPVAIQGAQVEPIHADLVAAAE